MANHSNRHRSSIYFVGYVVDYGGVKMKIPKKLEEKRDFLAAEKKEPYNETYKPIVGAMVCVGFDEACNLLLPEIEKLEEALMHSKIGFYSVSFVTDSSDLKMNMINLGIHCKSQENKIDQALQSLREFLGER